MNHQLSKVGPKKIWELTEYLDYLYVPIQQHSNRTVLLAEELLYHNKTEGMVNWNQQAWLPFPASSFNESER